MQDKPEIHNGKELDDLLRLHAERLRAFVDRRVSNREDAEDIVQDTLLQLLRSLSILQNPIGQVSAWLYTVAHNLIVNHDRKHRESEWPGVAAMGEEADDEAYLGDLSEIMVGDNDGPEMQMLRSMVWQELDKVLAELPDEQRMALVMTEVEGLSTAEAARRMNVSQGTFLSRKHYAVIHVRKRMQGLYRELVGG